MKRNDIVKKIQQAEAERKRLADGIKAQKEAAEKRKAELSSRLNNMDPAASFEDFKKIQTEAATNDAFISHLEYAERQLKEPTDAAKAEYKSIITALQADTDAAHNAAGAAILGHLNEIEKIIRETDKADNETRDLVGKTSAAYAMPQNAKKVTYCELGESFPVTMWAPFGSILKAKQQIEENRKKGKPF